MRDVSTLTVHVVLGGNDREAIGLGLTWPQEIILTKFVGQN